MRRYPVVIGATVAGLAGVLSFHSHSVTTAFSSGPAKGAGANGPSSSSSGHSTTPTTSTPGATTTPKGTTTPASTPSTTPAPPSGGSGGGTVTGTLEQYGYGQLSVRVTMAGGKITKLAVATLQTADTYSQQLANQVIPILRREVLAAQSARINGLSGATYTSEAYAYSVQSAIDKLKK